MVLSCGILFQQFVLKCLQLRRGFGPNRKPVSANVSLGFQLGVLVFEVEFSHSVLNLRDFNIDIEPRDPTSSGCMKVKSTLHNILLLFQFEEVVDLLPERLFSLKRIEVLSAF